MVDYPTPGDAGEFFADGEMPTSSLVRPYSRTGGRTKPKRDLDLEALVVSTVNGREASASPLLSPEHASVIQLCRGTVSVAEIAARLAVPDRRRPGDHRRHGGSWVWSKSVVPRLSRATNVTLHS